MVRMDPDSSIFVSQATVLVSQATNPEQHLMANPLGWIPELKTAMKSRKILGHAPG